MSIFRNDMLGSWTRGGQAIVHNVRMTTQVFFQTGFAGLALWIGGIIWYGLEQTTDYQRFVLLKLLQASLQGDVPAPTQILFRTPKGRQHWTTTNDLMNSGVAHHVLQDLEKILIQGAAISGGFALLTLFWAWFYFTRTGRGLAPTSSFAVRGLAPCGRCAVRCGGVRAAASRSAALLCPTRSSQNIS
jgi:hypothetical protein